MGTTKILTGSSPAPALGSSRARIFIRKHLWFLILVVACSAFAAYNLNRGWVPHDDGALAQSAERVLHGELPHRDFDEAYGGLLDYLHAAAFAIFGIKLLSLRFVVFFFFLCWLPCVYAIALRFVPPSAAASVMAMAAVWSIPLYPGSMPSWYNLFFATFACLLLFKFVEAGRSSWIFAAGCCCGVSILIKTTGIYAVAAALLTLVHCEQDAVAPGSSLRSRWPGVFTGFELISLAGFVTVVLRILGSHLSIRFLFAFLLPVSILTVYLVVRIVRTGSTLPDIARFRALTAMILPLVLGIVVPIAVYLLPYLASGSSGALYRGLFEAPLRRLNVTVWAPIDPVHSWAAVLLLSMIVVALYARARAWQTLLFLVAAVYLFFQSAHHPFTYRPIWDSLAFLLPYTVVVVVVLLLAKGEAPGKPEHSKIFSILAFAVCCNLIRYPFDGAIYLAYVLPLLFLAITAASRLTPRRSWGMLGVLVLFVCAFAVFRARSSYLAMMSVLYVRDEMTAHLGVERGREILVNPRIAREYQRVMELVGSHSHTAYIYAGPDAPDIYFLSGKINPTRTMFDFLDTQAEQQALHALREKPIEVVVVRLSPQFSPPLGSELRGYIEVNFPNSQRLDDFEVRWRR